MKLLRRWRDWYFCCQTLIICKLNNINFQTNVSIYLTWFQVSFGLDFFCIGRWASVDGTGLITILPATLWLHLLDLKWSNPFDSYHSPEAFLVSSDETESLESHFFSFVFFISMQELVGRDPLGEGAYIFPEVLIVLISMPIGSGQGSFLCISVYGWFCNFSWRSSCQSSGN